MIGRTMDTIDEAILYLPREIIEEILARLPVKPLLKFRCVSNSWLSIISSSHFIKTHLTVSTNMANFSYLINTHPHYQIKRCSLTSLISEPLIAASAIDYPRKTPRSRALVVGSCNGLFCISIAEREFCLWNPSTRVSRKLPIQPVLVPVVNLSQRYFNKALGFGYDETNDDYKIVVIFQESETESPVVLKSILHIYSLKANSWKRINDFNGVLTLFNKGKFANGKLHFWAYSSFDTGNSRMVIVSFDLKSEEFGTVELPNCGDGSFNCFLEVLGGCICVLCHHRYENISSHVWVLKEYGVKESWTKVVTIGPKRIPHPLCMLSNGDIVFSFGTHFKILNSKEKYLRSPEVTRRLGFNNTMEAYNYVESLVSL